MAMGGGMDHGSGMDMGMMMAPPPSSSMPMPMSMHKMKMMMHMTFFWGRRVEILFSGWPGDRGLGAYLLALFLVFVAAALIECLSFLPLRRHSRRPGVSGGLLLTGLAAVRTGLSYVVMLAVMSFNVGVLLVAIAGHAIGFFVFGTGIFFKRSCNETGGGAEHNGDGGQGIGHKC